MSYGRILRPTRGANAPRPLTSRDEQNVPYRYIRPMGSGRPPFITHRFYSPSGTEKWVADHGHAVYGVAVDSRGGVYTCGGDIQLIPDPRPDDWVAQYRLAKWSSKGKLIWRIDNDTGLPAGGFGPPHTFTVRGYDIAVDSDDNIWLATGIALEKYSPDGDLLLSRVGRDDTSGGVWSSRNYINSIRRVGVTSNDLVVFGSVSPSVDQSVTMMEAAILDSNTCQTDGTDYGFVYPAFSVSWLGNGFYNKSTNTTSPYAFDDDGYFYHSALTTLPGGPDPFFTGGTAFAISVLAHNLTLVGVGPNAESHQSMGIQDSYSAANDWPNWPGSRAIAVYSPTKTVLLAWGLDGIGSIKEIGTIVGVPPAAPYINDRPDLVSELYCCSQGVLSVNSNFRYLYGLTPEGFSDDETVSHRVREYPDTLIWEGYHGGVVRDGIMLPDNQSIIGGDRVPA